MSDLGFNTYCKDCHFEELDEHGNQISCTLNKLEHFVKMEKVIDVEDKHFVILNTVCNSLRNQEWVDTVEKLDGYFPLETRIKNQLEKETKISLTWIIVDNVSNRSFAEINFKLIDRLTEINSKDEVVFVSKNSRILNQDNILYKNIHEKFDNPFKITTCLEPTLSLTEMSDECFSKINSQFYIIYDLAQTIPLDIYNNLNRIISKVQLPIVFLDSYKNYGSVVSKKLHEIAGKYPKQFLQENAPEYNHTWKTVKNYLESVS